jgi:hypothetical protein
VRGPAGAPPTAEHRAAVLAGLALVPAGASVSAQSELVPRLSQRERAWEFPQSWRRADWVVVDAYGQRSTQSLDAGFDAALATVRATYARVYARDGVEVFRRPGGADARAGGPARGSTSLTTNGGGLTTSGGGLTTSGGDGD